MSEGKFYASDNPEEWFCAGPYDTLEDAKVCAPSDLDIVAGQEFWVGTSTNHVPQIDVDVVLEGLREKAYEEVGDITDGWLEDVTPQQEKELSDALNSTLQVWLQRVNKAPAFGVIENTQRFVVPEINLGEAK
jgi:hypothetical protein